MRHRTLAAAVLAAGFLIPAAPAAAHPLDEVLQQVYLAPGDGALGIELDLVPGATVAAAFARGIDTDGDRTFEPAETSAHMAAVGRGLSLTVDGRTVPITVTGSSYPDQTLVASGGGTVSVQATAPLPPGAHQVEFRDAYDSGPSTTVQMSVTTAPDAPAVAGDITHADGGRTILMHLTPRTTTDAAAPARETGLTERTLTALHEPLRSPWALLVLIGVCMLLGALHALTPGHGKTMLAAYLVGRGTPRQAVALGGIVTVTHTSSVLVLGGAVLVAGHYVLPGVLVPALELLAGAIVLLVGVRIVRRRWQTRNDQRHHDDGSLGHHRHGRPGSADSDLRDHGQGDREYPDHGHDDHSPRDHERDHERGVRRHRRPGRRRELAAMGMSGGLVPCPEALSILIIAVGLHRTGLGLAMIVAFSAGLAAVLVGLGLVLVTARDSFAGLRPARNPVLLTRLPVVSAVVVALLGAAMTLTGAVSVAAATGAG
jgi:ABC-type nickel/cobalt efflux system permease component RcnA